jgi:hypothetical protein
MVREALAGGGLGAALVAAQFTRQFTHWHLLFAAFPLLFFGSPRRDSTARIAIAPNRAALLGWELSLL